MNLDSSIGAIMLQFSFSNPEVVPPLLWHLPPETVAERIARKSLAGGTVVIQPTENCSIISFVNNLEQAGYVLVNAFCKERIHGKDLVTPYYVLRFVFIRYEDAQITEAFDNVRHSIMDSLRGICETALWRVRAYLNPTQEDDQYLMSINLEVRQPLFSSDGRPAMVWQKDENGNRIGDRKVPLMPDYLLELDTNPR